MLDAVQHVQHQTAVILCSDNRGQRPHVLNSTSPTEHRPHSRHHWQTVDP